MSSTKIAVVIGSLRKDSINRKLALALAALAPEDFSFEHVVIDDLPLDGQVRGLGQAAPASLTVMRAGSHC